MILSNLLRGEKIYLSALNKDDAPTVAHWETNSEYMRLGDANPARPRTTDKHADWIEAANKQTDTFLFGIRLVYGDTLIGSLALDGIEWPHGVAWLGLGIGNPEYWGKGYGSEASLLALRFGFWEANLYRIQLTVFEYNQRAIASYEKLGFVREGTYRQFLQRDGQRYDMHLYGLLRPEWEARNAEQALPAGE